MTSSLDAPPVPDTAPTPDVDAMRPRARVRSRPPVVIARSERITALREACAWTVSELARRAGTDQSGVTRLLAHEQNAGGPMIGGLIAAFREVFGEHVGFDQLFEIVEPADPRAARR